MAPKGNKCCSQVRNRLQITEIHTSHKLIHKNIEVHEIHGVPKFPNQMSLVNIINTSDHITSESEVENFIFLLYSTAVLVVLIFIRFLCKIPFLFFLFNQSKYPVIVGKPYDWQYLHHLNI